jgi:hypothetical protein
MERKYGYFILLGLLAGVIFGTGLGAANGSPSGASESAPLRACSSAGLSLLLHLRTTVGLSEE